MKATVETNTHSVLGVSWRTEQQFRKIGKEIIHWVRSCCLSHTKDWGEKQDVWWNEKSIAGWDRKNYRKSFARKEANSGQNHVHYLQSNVNYWSFKLEEATIIRCASGKELWCSIETGKSTNGKRSWDRTVSVVNGQHSCCIEYFPK